MEYLKNDSEEFLRRNTGLVFIKPDAVQLGVAEEIIDYIATRVYVEGMGILDKVCIIQLKSEDVLAIYPEITDRAVETVTDYLTEDVSILVTFKGNQKDDIWQFLEDLRGKRLLDRTFEELENAGGIKTGVRDIIPIAGTRDLYKGVFDKLKLRQLGKEPSFTDGEFKIYCRNLIHIPDRVTEAVALLKLLTLS